MSADPLQGDRPLGDVLDFMRLLWEVDHGLQSLSKRMRINVGITGPQRLVIRIVGKVPGISAKEIARLLHLHKSSLSGVLERLETRGMLDRKQDDSDRRRAVFKLTAKGRALDAVHAGTVEAAIRRGLGKLSPQKIAAAEQVLAAIAAELPPSG